MPRTQLAHRLGRRGAMLTVVGIIHLLFGLQILLRSTEQTTPGAYHLLIPWPVSAALWLTGGLVAIVLAWRKVPTGRPRRRFDGDVLAWPVLYVMPFVRMTSYFASWLLWIGGGADAGSAGGWYLAAIHGALLVIPLICSGWPERTEQPRSLR